MNRFFVVLLAITLLCPVAGTAYAETNFLSGFNSLYGTAGTALDSCFLCHPSGTDLNSYASDWKKNGFNFLVIESLDSDGDTFTNSEEINARTFPGDAASQPSPPDIMEIPAGTSTFPFVAAVSPSTDPDPALAIPVGLGSVAQGGDTLTVHIKLLQFSGPVDIYAAYSMPGDSETIVIIRSDTTMVAVSLQQIIQSLATGITPVGVEPWRPAALGPVDEGIFSSLPVAGLPSGTYTAYLFVSPANSLSSFYLWVTQFSVPQ